MVTADRPHLCKRALLSYQAQTYPHKELVVLDNGTRPMDELLGTLPSDEVHYMRVEPHPDLVIGALRNLSLEAATGPYVAPQWDDDDWSHPDRLTQQVAMLEAGFDACTLPATLMHVDDPTYFDHPFVGQLPNGVPPTIVHRRDAEIRYPPLRRTSDTAYVNAWRDLRYAILPADTTHHYIRYFHGGNLWEQEHFLRRMRNTAFDLLAYGWYHYVRRDVRLHPRFQLSPEARAGFELYLEHSRQVGLFANHPTA
ncbi:MAG: glycosyltransferase family 2 protein [Bacteroidota bacterium]